MPIPLNGPDAFISEAIADLLQMLGCIPRPGLWAERMSGFLESNQLTAGCTKTAVRRDILMCSGRRFLKTSFVLLSGVGRQTVFSMYALQWFRLFPVKKQGGRKYDVVYIIFAAENLSSQRMRMLSSIGRSQVVREMW